MKPKQRINMPNTKPEALQKEEIFSKLTGGRVPGHVAIIMDGNGRGAQERNLPRAAGHRAGAENIWRILERFWEHGIGYITLYAFSTENWNRPQTEVRSLIRLLDRFIKNEMDTFQKNNVQLKHLGHLEQLPLWLQNRIEAAIEATKENDGLVLSICFSYGGRDDLVTALQKIIDSEIPAHAVSEETIHNHLFTAGLPDPDLVIRTAGDQRLSNFLIWQCAYAELYFTDTYWPDFGREDIDLALAEYGRRKRKFGRLLPSDEKRVP